MSIPIEPPRLFAPLFDLERDRLLDLLRSLDNGDWGRPTPCPAWNVLGLTSHLVGDDLGLLARSRDQHHGTKPPDGVDEAGFIRWLDELQAGWVTAARRLSPRIVVELLAWSGPQVSAMIAEQDPSECTAHVSWASDQAVPAWLDQSRELSEYWIHRQQLRQAVGMATDLRTDVAGPVLDGLKWAYPHRLSFLDVPIGTTALIEVAGDDLDSSWQLTLGANGWRFSDMAAVNPSAHLSMTAEQAWRLLTNNLPADQQMQLSAVGQFQIVEALRQTRAIIGVPR